MSETPHLLNPGKESHGYATVVLYKNGTKNTRKVASLVAEAFLGRRPEGMEVCHGANGQSDDSLSNISYGTRSKNRGEDRVRDGTSNRGERSGSAKLTEEQAMEIFRQAHSGIPHKIIAGFFGITKGTVSDIKRRRSWFWLHDAEAIAT